MKTIATVPANTMASKGRAYLVVEINSRKPWVRPPCSAKTPSSRNRGMTSVSDAPRSVAYGPLPCYPGRVWGRNPVGYRNNPITFYHDGRMDSMIS
jgi:hypothetical protein